MLITRRFFLSGLATAGGVGLLRLNRMTRRLLTAVGLGGVPMTVPFEVGHSEATPIPTPAPAATPRYEYLFPYVKND